MLLREKITLIANSFSGEPARECGIDGRNLDHLIVQQFRAPYSRAKMLTSETQKVRRLNHSGRTRENGSVAASDDEATGRPARACRGEADTNLHSGKLISTDRQEQSGYAQQEGDER